MPEVALTYFGAGHDVSDSWVHELNRRTLEEIFAGYPRGGFGDATARLIDDQCGESLGAT